MSTNTGCLPDCEGLTHNIECPNVTGQAAELRAKWSGTSMTPEEKAREWVAKHWFRLAGCSARVLSTTETLDELNRLHAEIARLEAEREKAERQAAAMRDSALAWLRDCERSLGRGISREDLEAARRALAADAGKDLFTREQARTVVHRFVRARRSFVNEEIQLIDELLDEVADGS